MINVRTTDEAATSKPPNQRRSALSFDHWALIIDHFPSVIGVSVSEFRGPGSGGRTLRASARI